MKKGILIGIFGLLVSLVPTPNASAQSYSGTTVSPEGDGVTYNVTATSGDTVTLSDVGSGTLAVTFANNVNGSIVVEESSSLPTDASSDAPGNISTYFDVTLNGLTNNDVSSAVWKFSVPKSFLTQNGVTATNIFLHHFNGTAWERLSTAQTAANDTTVTFEAQVDSFSPFAVSAVEGLSNTGSPYLFGAVIGGSILAIIGGTFVLSRKQRA